MLIGIEIKKFVKFVSCDVCFDIYYFEEFVDNEDECFDLGVLFIV